MLRKTLSFISVLLLAATVAGAQNPDDGTARPCCWAQGLPGRRIRRLRLRGPVRWAS